MRNQGIGSWTVRRARMSPDQIAIVHGEDEQTYGELYERATRTAHVLAGLGVGSGDRVVYLGPNEPPFLETLFGTGFLGAIFVPLNTRLAAPGAGRHPARQRNVGAGARADTRRARRRAGRPVDESVDPDDIAMIMYTSGATGRPKGAALSHANIGWNTSWPERSR